MCMFVSIYRELQVEGYKKKGSNRPTTIKQKMHADAHSKHGLSSF